MKHVITFLFISICSLPVCYSQEIIPFDTTNWEFNARGYVVENFQGQNAIYLHQGFATLKESNFLNGTIEFDIFLTERRSFPGIRFRAVDSNNMESFYFRPHQSGNPDANQATPVANGLSGWQLYFGPTYSFKYDYEFDTWTHVKLVVKDQYAQIFLDHAEQPNLTWQLKHAPKSGEIALGGGGPSAMHYANFVVKPNEGELAPFEIKLPKAVDQVIPSWIISDKFDETELDNLDNLDQLIKERKWGNTVKMEENHAANIAFVADRYGTEGTTVFAKVTIQSDRNQTKLLQFGYSDRAVAILNGTPIYKGDNGFVTRDYRYLGTIGFFDSIYLDLKRGENTLLFAVSENFGGWGITARFVDMEGVEIR